LARGIDEAVEAKDLALTAYVATRWYRPPEVLLYRTPYGKPLDMWAVGCIFAELLSRQVFLPAQSSIDQLNLIFNKLGTPTEDVIARIPSQRSMSYLRRLKRQEGKPMKYWFPKASAEALDLIEGLLKFDPKERLTAEQALLHPYLAEHRQQFHQQHQQQHQHDSLYIFSKFDFSFDERCKTLADLKSAIWDELKIYRKPAILQQMPMEIQKSARLDEKDPLSGGRLSMEAEALASIKPTLQKQSRFKRVEK
jgi:serine/threonine protein kinase